MSGLKTYRKKTCFYLNEYLHGNEIRHLMLAMNQR